MQKRIKRSWESDTNVETLAMANCSLLGQSRSSPDRAFNCKTCNKKFKSFQALGGHCASHKRTKTTYGNVLHKPKTHECSVCGLEFAVGQALGGHMRRHRDKKSGGVEPVVTEKRGLCMDLNLTPYENDMKLWSVAVNMSLAI